jgi:hypothetical protein
MEFFLKLLAPFVVWAAPAIIWLAKFTPYFPIKNKDGSPYMDRYWVIFPRWWLGGWGVRLHEILSSDDDRALHDHPWRFGSIILKSGYFEVLGAFDTNDAAVGERYRHDADYPVDAFVAYEKQTRKWVIGRHLGVGDVNIAQPDTFHRLRLYSPYGKEQPAVTLFFSGPPVQKWGFMVDGAKVPSKQYIAKVFGRERLQEVEQNLNKTFGARKEVV